MSGDPLAYAWPDSTTDARHAELILASTSPRRHELLARLGLPFEIVPVAVPENPLSGETPGQTATRLALAKAHAALARLPRETHALIIAADTVVVYRGQLLGKPETPEAAVAMLRRLRGKIHRVISAVAVLDSQSGRTRVRTETTRVRLRPLSDEEIRRYVATGDPLDKAGAYAIQNRTFHPVESIQGCYSNVVGLPLCALAEELGEFGVRVPGEWHAGHGACQCAQRTGAMPG